MNPQTVTTELVWNFPGGTAGFIVAASAALLLIGTAYRFTLRRLTWYCRLLPALLRFGLVVLLLAILGDPRRVETSTFTAERSVNLGAVFDVSSSMRTPGLLGHSRLQEALEKFARAKLPEGNVRTHVFTFAEKLEPVESVESVARLAAMPFETVEPTRFIEALTGGAPLFDFRGLDAVLVFTDGIDTTDADSAAAMAALGASRANYRFIPMTTELAMRKFLELRKLDAPARALLNATATVNIAAAYSNLIGSDRVELVVRDREETELCRIPGRHSGPGGGIIFRFDLTLTKLGDCDFSAELLLNGEPMQRADFNIKVIPRERKRVLLFHGSHDWAVRYLKNAVAAHDRSSLVACRHRADAPNFNFPPREELIANYDVVIILNLERRQCSPELESELLAFLQQGGGVIFITGNPAVAAEYARSELENLLPVEFAPQPAPDHRTDQRTSAFRNEIRNYANTVNAGAEDRFIRARESAYKPLELKPFILTEAGAEAPVFQAGNGETVLPCYLDAARVSRLKPGAQALAVERDATGAENILLAVQRFGYGRSVVLATDPLWRWKLALPSDSRASEIFWENLLSYAGDSGKQTLGAFTLSDYLPPVGAPLTILHSGATAPREATVEVAGESIALHFVPAPDAAGKFTADFTPNRPGPHRIRIDGETRSFTATRAVRDRELDAPAPNLFLLQRLGGTENSRTLTPDEELDLSGLFATRGETLTRSVSRPVWPRGALLACLLILYSLEWIVRRILKMV